MSLLKQIELDSPLVYWPLSQSGTTMYSDVSGNGRTLIDAGGGTGPAFSSTSPPVPGDSGSCNWASATNNQFVADAAWNSLTSAWTLELWIMLTSNSAQQGLIEKYNGGTDGGYFFRVNSSGKLVGSSYSGAGAHDDLIGNTTLQTSIRYHVVYTYTSARLGTLYVNGVADGSKTHSSVASDGTARLDIGARSGDQLFRFSGGMSQVAIYSTALSADRVKSHYQAGIRNSVMV